MRFLPALVMSLLAGAVVDSYDRRRVSQLAQAGTLVCVLALFVFNISGNINTPIIYAIIFVMAIAGMVCSIASTVRSAKRPYPGPIPALFTRQVTGPRLSAAS